MIYRALTGCMPVDSTERLKHDDLCEPSVLNANIPQHVSKVIMDGMNLSGRDRIQTITELVTRLFEQPAPSRTGTIPIQSAVTASSGMPNRSGNEPPRNDA